MSQMFSSHLWPGAALALGSAALFGLTTPLSKLLLDGIDPQLLAGVMYLGAGLGLALVHLARSGLGIPVSEAPLRIADAPWLAAVALFGGGLGPLLLMLGLVSTGAANGSLLLNVEGLATMGIAWLILRENVDRWLLMGALAILLGAVIVSWDGQGLSLDRGALLIIAACICWGIDNNVTRKLSAVDPVTIAMIKGLAAGTVNGGLALARWVDLPGPGWLAGAALLGFIGVGISLVLFILALRHLGTARTGAYFSLAPFIGAVTAVVALGEPFTFNLGVAGLLMGGGLWLHLAERHQHTHNHETLDHEHGHVHDEHHDHAHDADSVQHSHRHLHSPLVHAHPHYPDLHHRHPHPHRGAGFPVDRRGA